ncbi:MAG: Gfo/Idh/MocA family oxidoreductase [Marinilabiliales bacterium]|nr:Gfo/Idh/MocA family oxidoreductase [Marinilabiliales bacterium]
MKTNRRNFLRTAAVAGAAAVTAGSAVSCSRREKSSEMMPEVRLAVMAAHSQTFNMSGYRAPALGKVRIGFIGLGMRGPGAVERMAHIEGVEIVALCDKYTDRVDKMQSMLSKFGMPQAKAFSGTEEAWKGLCDDPDIDLVYICTPWAWHTPMALYAMEAGKHVAVEVPAAKTVDECWQLVETSERTRMHCMQLENCCYDFFELLTLNMARQGLFGEIVHGEGAYIHDLRWDFTYDKNGYADMWRLKENVRNGNLYPTHGLGPVCQIMNINRGDRMDYLTSMSTDDFAMASELGQLAKEDPFYVPFADKKYRGNMNTSLIRTASGRSIMIQHDVSSPRPYSRIHLISGTKGAARKWPSPARIALGHSWLKPEELAALEAQYTPEIVKRVGEMAKEIGGHGGMDFIMDWRLIDCLRNGLPLDQDVYDAALWSVITPLSEWSVANRSSSIDVPDFTCGSWELNKPFDPNLAEGGNTKVIGIQGSSNQLEV